MTKLRSVNHKIIKLLVSLKNNVPFLLQFRQACIDMSRLSRIWEAKCFLQPRIQFDTSYFFHFFVLIIPLLIIKKYFVKKNLKCLGHLRPKQMWFPEGGRGSRGITSRGFPYNKNQFFSNSINITK